MGQSSSGEPKRELLYAEACKHQQPVSRGGGPGPLTGRHHCDWQHDWQQRRRGGCPGMVRNGPTKVGCCESRADMKRIPCCCEFGLRWPGATDQPQGLACHCSWRADGRKLPTMLQPCSLQVYCTPHAQNRLWHPRVLISAGALDAVVIP